MIEKWKIFELDMTGKCDGNPFTDIWLHCTFSNGNILQSTEGFYKGKDIYTIRFMPPEEGTWTYLTASNLPELNAHSGYFECESSGNGNNGRVVRSRDVRRATMPNIYENETNHRFSYENGIPYHPFGTSCLAWGNTSEDINDATLDSLAHSPFNKVRIYVFPDSRAYTDKEPEEYPYLWSTQGVFDYTRFNNIFFEKLESKIAALDDLGIQAELVLFHPWDKWGFHKMSRQENLLYISYIARRLSHFKNVWWLLADYYDKIDGKTSSDWDDYAAVLMNHDVYGHMRSIQNYTLLYDYSRPWITHCSIRQAASCKTTEKVTEWRTTYQKPVIVEDCAFEGDIPALGSLPAEEMMRRLWEAAIRGGYACYNEAFSVHQKPAWWLQGGNLYGKSPDRIAFLRNIIEAAPKTAAPLRLTLETHGDNWDCPCLLDGEDYFLYYFGFNRPSFRTYSLPSGKKYEIELIDTWNMTSEKLPGTYEGNIRIELPMKQYMAVQMHRI